MSPKQKAIATTGGLFVVALVCAGVAWSAAEVGGLLGTCLTVLAVIFVLAGIASAVSCVGFVRSSDDAFPKPAPTGKRSSSSATRELPADFQVSIPDAAPKKQPRPAKKPASAAAVSTPVAPLANAKKPRPATRPAGEASAD